VRDDLCIGFLLKSVTPLLQFLPEARKILDHTVVDYRYVILAVELRVGVLLQWGSMGGPPRMAYPDFSREVIQVKLGMNYVHISLIFFHVEAAFVDRSFTDGVVAAILQTLECCVDQGCGGPIFQHTTEDATHIATILSKVVSGYI